MTSDDPLNNEVSVSGELTETGLKGAAKSRALSAFDRLLGNVIDYPNSFLEGAATKRRAKAESNVRVIEALAEASVKEIAERYREYARPAIEAHYREMLRKQENKEAVTKIAVEDLAQAPDAKPTEGNSDDKALSEDWLNYFTSYAEKASSTQLREAFGRILSGEILKPGSFSFSTLRIVSELDAQSAGLFQSLASKAIAIPAGDPHPSCIVTPDPLRGALLHNMMKLEAIGLLQDVGGSYGMDLERVRSTNLWIRCGSFLLQGEAKDKKPGRLSLIRLTPSGAELCSIIPQGDEAATRELGRELIRRGFAVTLHKIDGAIGAEIKITKPGEPLIDD